MRACQQHCANDPECRAPSTSNTGADSHYDSLPVTCPSRLIMMCAVSISSGVLSCDVVVTFLFVCLIDSHAAGCTHVWEHWRTMMSVFG